MLNLEGIQAVLITHDHADHIKAVGHLGEKHGIPVYTTPEIHEGMKHSYCMTERLSPERTRFIRKEETFSVGDSPSPALKCLTTELTTWATASRQAIRHSLF